MLNSTPERHAQEAEAAALHRRTEELIDRCNALKAERDEALVRVSQVERSQTLLNGALGRADAVCLAAHEHFYRGRALTDVADLVEVWYEERHR